VSTAIGFLAWLRADSIELPHATQAHLGRWLADGPRARHTLRSFIQWARQRHLVTDLDVPPTLVTDLDVPPTLVTDLDVPPTLVTDLDVPPTLVAAPSHLQHDHEQWQQLRRCLNEASMPMHLRVAGSLVLLFGLSVTRLAVGELDVGAGQRRLGGQIGQRLIPFQDQ
jgi:hypothetical protein